MSNENKKPPEQKAKSPTPTGGGGPNNVVNLHCPADNCKKKPTRAGFCEEHFTWFKEGLVDRAGHKPKDFDKKYQAFLHRKAG